MARIERINAGGVAAMEAANRLFGEAFGNEAYKGRPASRAHLERLLEDPKFIALVAYDGEEMVGALAGYELVKFEADWCGPCQAMKPMIGDLAEEFGGRLTVATLDIDQNNQTPYRFGVRGVPTVILFDKGKIVGQRVGLPRKADLASMIEARLSAA